jgi:hypothetical protein
MMWPTPEFLEQATEDSSVVEFRGVVEVGLSRISGRPALIILINMFLASDRTPCGACSPRASPPVLSP